MASTSNRGFASMDREKQREIASKGGRAAHMKGTAHEFTADEARQAGRKGGVTVSQNREHMAAIGRKGGQESGSRHRAAKSNPDMMGGMAGSPQPPGQMRDQDQVDIDQSVGQQNP
ncbi:MAG TPA: KGG domain-containing protein [Tepidisphaeraceae bacterium]